MNNFKLWKCKKCDWEGNFPLIIPAVDCGRVVDIIDVLCPMCPGDVVFRGNEREKDKFWDKYYEDK